MVARDLSCGRSGPWARRAVRAPLTGARALASRSGVRVGVWGLRAQGVRRGRDGQLLRLQHYVVCPPRVRLAQYDTAKAGGCSPRLLPD